MRDATPKPAATDQFLTVLEVAARLNVSKSTVYNLVADGALRHHRLGKGKVRPRGVRIPAGAVIEYLDSSQTTKEVA